MRRATSAALGLWVASRALPGHAQSPPVVPAPSPGDAARAAGPPPPKPLAPAQTEAASPRAATPTDASPGARPADPPATPPGPDEAAAPAAPDPPAAATSEFDPLRFTLEAVEVRGNERTRGRVVLRYVPFRAGMVLDVDDPELELTRFRLLGTGFFSSVSLSLRKGSKRGSVVLVISVIERNTIVVNDVWLGLSASATNAGETKPLSAYAGADVAETNLAGTGITLGAAFGIAEDQAALRLRFLDPAFLGSSWMAQGTLFFNAAREFYGNRDVLYDDPSVGSTTQQDYAVVRYKRFGGSLGAGHDLSVSTQVWFDYRLESIDASTPLAASHMRGLDREPLTYDLLPGGSVLSTLRASLLYDTRDQPFLPTRGWSLGLAGDLSLAPLGSNYPYQKVSGRVSRWWTLPWAKHVVRLELFGGAISGHAPVYEKFYVADLTDLLPDRVLDLNTDSRPAPNLLHTDIVEERYGDYAAKLQGEYRIPLYRGHRAVYGIDLFTAAGLYAVASARDLTDPPRGYGGLARFPADLTFNLGLRMDTNAGGFVFAFSNVLGFVPALGGPR